MEFEFEPGRFYHNDDEGNLMAEVTYQPLHNETVMAVDHTFVREDLRGQGIAAQLIRAVVDKARAENKKILPICTYAKVEFGRRPEYADVLSAD